MGSPLGVAFANLYMCNLENNILQTQPSLKPTIYCRYIDDIFLVTPNIQQLQLLKNVFEQNSASKAERSGAASRSLRGKTSV